MLLYGVFYLGRYRLAGLSQLHTEKLGGVKK